MKITKRQLRKIIRETVNESQWQDNIDSHMRDVDTTRAYMAWIEENGHDSPADSSALAAFAIEADLEPIQIVDLANFYKLGFDDVLLQMKDQARQWKVNPGRWTK